MANRFPTLRAGWAIPSVAALILVPACDRQDSESQQAPQPSQAAPSSPTPDGGSGTVAAIARGNAPPKVRIDIQAGGTNVTAGSVGNRASVDPVPEGQYQWTVLGGSPTDGADTSDLTYSVAPDALVVNLFCHIKGADGLETTSFTHQNVVPMPVLGAFEARPAVTTAGTVAKLSWNASNFKTLVLSPGEQDVSTGVGITVQPAETTTYTLTATNEAGAKVARTTTLKVVPAPQINSFGVEGAISMGQALTLRASFQGGKAEIRQGDTVLASSDQSPLSIQVTLSDKSSFSLSVTNEAGASVTQTRTFQKPGY